MRLTAYHATDLVRASAILREGFRLDVPNRTDPGDFGQAVYLTTSMARARAFGRAILTVDLELKAPLDLTSHDAYALVIDELGLDTIHGQGHAGGRAEAARLAREHFLSQGHDALLSRCQDLEETEVAVYDLGSIRSIRL